LFVQNTVEEIFFDYQDKINAKFIVDLENCNTFADKIYTKT